MRDLLSKLDALLSETSLDDIKNHPEADDPRIQQAVAAKEKEEGDQKDDQQDEDVYQIGDEFGISFSEDFEISTVITDILEDGIVVELDDYAMKMLTNEGLSFLDVQIDEEKQKGLDGKACWKGYKRMGTKMKGGKRVDNCVKMGEDSDVEESGLQYYTGKKKYGKEGMATLAAAGREGASEEELGKIKDKYKKEDMVEANDNLNILVDKTVKALMMAKDKGMRSLPEPAYADDQDLVEFMEQHLPNILNKVPDDSWNDFADTVFDKFFNASGKDNIELEAKYQGREVPLGKKMAGDVKKSKVYVKNPQGNVVKVNFGDKKMKIKKSNPARRKSFRARHNCANPGPRHKARYWSCRSW
jgi:hypothetical protein